MGNDLKFMLAIQVAMLPAIVFDIPIARQIIGVVNISIIPGILIIGILKLNFKSRIDTFLFSVGLSFAFLMFIGFVVNGLGPVIGVSRPMSLLPLLTAIGAILFVMTFICCKRGAVLSWSSSLPSMTQLLRVLLLVTVPLLAISGAFLADASILLLMVIAIAVLVLLTVFSRKAIPFEFYPIVILTIAISILFHGQFISTHLLGWDVLSEFYVFRITNANSLWNPAAISIPVELIGRELSSYNGMLSVTVLPTIYSNLLNIPGEWIFKFGYLIIYSLVPLTMYQIYKQGFGKTTAFLSAFYFVLFPRFYAEERRQIIGELFLVLLIFLILYRDINPRKRNILLCVLGAALVVSHYSLSYIFMFCILSAGMIMFVIKKFLSNKWDLKEKRTINSSFVLLILTLNVFWYIVVAPTESRLLIDVVSHVATSLITGFSSVESRGETVSEFVAPNLGSMTLVYKADYLINKIPYVLIVIGFLALVKNYRKMNIQIEYLSMVSSIISILLIVLVVPSFAPAFLAERFFHVSLLFLAPLCIYGGMSLLGWIRRKISKGSHPRAIGLRVMCIFLIAIFLFKVGFVYAIAGDTSISRYIDFGKEKNSNSPQIETALYEWYIPEQDVYSAIWLSHMTASDSDVYADETSAQHVLRAYGPMTLVEWKHLLSSNRTIENDAYVYLRYLNVQGWLKENGQFSNMTQISYQLSLADKIYSNGYSEVYYTPSGG